MVTSRGGFFSRHRIGVCLIVVGLLLDGDMANGLPEVDLYQTVQLDLPSTISSDYNQHQPYGGSVSGGAPAGDAAQFLREYDRQAAETCNRLAHAEWKFATNGSDFNRRRMAEQQAVADKFECLSWRRAASFDASRQSDANVRRQLQRIHRQGKCGLGDDKYAEYQHLIAVMKDIFQTARVCSYNAHEAGIQRGLIDAKMLQLDSDYYRSAPAPDYTQQYPFASVQQQQQHWQQLSPPLTTPSLAAPQSTLLSAGQPSAFYCDLRLDPDLVRLMAHSRNEPELQHVWHAWHDKIGPPLRNTFMRYLDLANLAARRQGFRDAGDQMRAAYEDADFYFVVQDLWAHVRPLYQQLFTYVRKGLVQRYGFDVIRPDGPIPAHLLGNMWAQNWQHVVEMTHEARWSAPAPSLGAERRRSDEIAATVQYGGDVTGEMLRQGFTPLKMFQMAEEFFTSMGMPAMSPEFWRNSQLQTTAEPSGRCSPSAWDFCNNVDYRIKQCTQITRDDFVNAHHEMAQVQYFMHYAGQPFVYRSGPNPGFSDAVAHAIGLSVGGPAHLQHIGLLPLGSHQLLNDGSSATSIDYLLSLAADKLPLMSFALALEKWRWYLFEKGPIGLNARWWDLRMRYQGVIPPVGRSTEHFDAAAKYQVIADQDYIRYYVSTVLQFQIFGELCEAAGHRGPLHLCDIYRSREAGRMLSDLMQQGASLSAAQVLKIITRGKTDRLSVEPMLEFFRPLNTWLEQQNRAEIVIGWNSNMDDVARFQPLHAAGRRNEGHAYLMYGILAAAFTIIGNGKGL